MVSKKLERIKMVSVLPVIYKIILEEFINEDSWSKNKTFLISEIKEALKILHSTKDK
jgi:fructose-1,6-bisphosphatase